MIRSMEEAWLATFKVRKKEHPPKHRAGQDRSKDKNDADPIVRKPKYVRAWALDPKKEKRKATLVTWNRASDRSSGSAFDRSNSEEEWKIQQKFRNFGKRNLKTKQVGRMCVCVKLTSSGESVEEGGSGESESGGQAQERGSERHRCCDESHSRTNDAPISRSMSSSEVFGTTVCCEGTDGVGVPTSCVSALGSPYYPLIPRLPSSAFDRGVAFFTVKSTKRLPNLLPKIR